MRLIDVAEGRATLGDAEDSDDMDGYDYEDPEDEA